MNSRDFAALPLASQLEYLRGALSEDSARELLELCAAIRDHAPLSHLARRLRDTRWFLTESNQRWFGEFLLLRSETAVHQILRELMADLGHLPAACADALADTLVWTLQRIPLARLSAMCLIDRALKHNFPDRRRAHVTWVVERVCDALAAGDLDRVPPDLLAQVPARNNDRMIELATRHGAEFVRALHAERVRMAADAISILGDAPKAVSQANAEELLARRVYTDPGHFLIELLQNAEDAGAETWKVVFERDRIVVWHDGVAFDARDLVGVTSIGQTTKRKQQIGFFGVGFKSVFEVTARPQVYSDVFNFEIADVSIPKVLSRRPAGVPRNGTVLILPLRNADDPIRSPKGLFEKARALDPCVLFTLPCIDVIDLSLAGDAPGGPLRHAIREVHQRWASIRQSPAGWEKRFLLQADDFRYTQGEREAGRADHTRIMVGVALDDFGVPVRLPVDAATIYSYLPTDERSGLAFWIQGHFDVPVDRERITAESSWNRWILGIVPRQLARIGAQIVAREDVNPHLKRRMAAGFLSILPLASELSNPVFHIIVNGLRPALAGTAVVPAVGHRLVAPPEAIIAASAHRMLFGEEPLAACWLDTQAPDDRRLHLVEPALSPRALATLEQLGVPTLDTARLIDVLERVLTPVVDGDRPADARAPSFLRVPDLYKLCRLYDLLLAELERLERGDRDAGPVADEASEDGVRRADNGVPAAASAVATLARLVALPIVCDADDNLRRPARVVRGNPAIRRIYHGLCTFTHPRLDDACTEGGGARIIARRLAPLWERLQVARIDVEALVAQLERELAGRPRPMAGLDGTRLPGSGERKAMILQEILANGSTDTKRRVARLPLFEGADGRYWPAADNATDDRGALLCDDGPTGQLLLEFYRREGGHTRPVLARSEAAGPAGALLEQLRVPALDIECLVSDIGRIPDRLGLTEPTRLHELHTLLCALRAEIPERLQRALSGLAIWPDRSGRPGALRVPGLSARDSAPYLVRIPADEMVVGLFPGVRFIDEQVRGLAHVRDMGVDSLGVAAVVDALAPDALAPLAIAPSGETLAHAHQFLLARLSDVGSRVREKLARYPAFLDERGQPCELGQLCRGDPEIRAIYAHGADSSSHRRRFIDPDGSSMRLVQALELQAHLGDADVVGLLTDLDGHRQALLGASPEGAPLVASTANLERILECIARRRAELPITVLERATRTPIFPDQHGALGTLADAGIGIMRAATGNQLLLVEPALRPLFMAAGIRVVSDYAQAATERIASSAGLLAIDLPLCIGHLLDAEEVTPGGPRNLLQSAPALGALYQLLADRREQLSERYPVTVRDGLAPASFTLCRLHIWETRAGGVRSANQLVDVSPLRALLGDAPASGAARASGTSREQADETHRAFDLVTLAESTQTAWDALSPLVAYRPVATYVTELTRSLMRNDCPLSQQHPLLGSVARIERVLAVYLASTDREEGRGDAARARPVQYRSPDQSLPVPLVTADERLTVRALFTCDRSTSLVLTGLPIARDLLHPDLHSEALTRALGLVELPLQRVLVALAGPEPQPDMDGSRPRQRVAAHPILHAPDRRARLYEWLEAHEAAIFASAECCQLLTSARLFPSERGTLLSASELVIDPDLPDLDVDWTPSSEIPGRLLIRLTRYLDVGSPAVAELIERHLLGAYQRAVRERESERAGTIVCYLARALRDHDVREIRAMLLSQGQSSFLLEDQFGNFQAPSALILPPPELEEHVTAVWRRSYPQPSPRRFKEPTHRLLIALGVATEPAIERVREALQRPSLTRAAALGLTAICSRLFWSEGDALAAELPLRTAAWLLDGTGCPRRPGELFGWSAELEALIGDVAELYPDPEVARILPDRLLATLGLRGLEQVELSHIVAHLDRCVATQAPLPFRVYQWMEQGLSAGWLQRGSLRTELDQRDWVWAHERYFHHSKVIGSWAVPYFGDRRGYWERGYKDCPNLCRLFAIAKDADQHSVAGFLQELAIEVQQRGDRRLLADEPALRHMLLTCYALLGEKRHAIDRRQPIILCAASGATGGDERAGLRLMPAASERVFRSDTPTLERLFTGVGSFFLVARGHSEQRTGVDEFYEQMGIRRLRSAFTIEVDGSSGRDVTDKWRVEVQGLRARLRALDAVLPRIRRQREHLASEGWLYEELLAPLATTRPIRVIERLRVRYRLDGVGDAQADIPAAYDRRQQQLMVDAEILSAPHEHTTGLALGLMSCIYDGPGEDQLVDIIEILLPMGTREAMDRYLDRRHFPVVDDGRARHPVDLLAERIGQILDFGLGNRLQRRFVHELGPADLEVWRDPELLAPLRTVQAGPRDRAALGARASLLLLDAAGLATPSSPLKDALTTLLAAESLAAVPAELLVVARDDEPLLSTVRRSQTEGAPRGEYATRQSGEYSSGELANLAAPPSTSSEMLSGEAGPLVPGSSRPGVIGSGLGGQLDHEAMHRDIMSRLRARLQDPRARLSPSSTVAPASWSVNGQSGQLGDGDQSGDSDQRAGDAGGQSLPTEGGPGQFDADPTAAADADSGADSDGLAELLTLFAGRDSDLSAGSGPDGTGEPGDWFADTVDGADDAAYDPTRRLSATDGAWPSAPESGLWRRISNFFGGGRRPEPNAFEPPLWARPEANCLAPRADIPPQLWTSSKALDRIARAPTMAVVQFSPPQLSLPWLYAAHSFGVSFEPYEQSWAALGQLPMGKLLAGSRATGASVRFVGQIVPGESMLPIPLYSRLSGAMYCESNDGEPRSEVLEIVDDGRASGQVIVRVTDEQPVIVHYEVELYEPPAVTGRHGHTLRGQLNAAQRPTMALRELPREVRTFVETERRAWREPWELCLAVQEFVKRRYLYDSHFADRPEVASVRDQLRVGQGNHHLLLLHASADDAYLGRGICYELNVLCAELLRHLGVPALVVTGWVLDEGSINRPDHLIALALIPSAHGPVAVPIDAATSSRGPIRELARRAPRPTTRAPTGRPREVFVPRLPGIWSQSASERAMAIDDPAGPGTGDGGESDGTSRAGSGGLAHISRAEYDHLLTQARMLAEAMPNIFAARGHTMPGALDYRQRLDAMAARAGDVDSVRVVAEKLYRVAVAELGRAVLVGALLSVMRGDLEGVQDISEPVQELVSMGLVAVRSEPRYRVGPSWHAASAESGDSDV